MAVAPYRLIERTYHDGSKGWSIKKQVEDIWVDYNEDSKFYYTDKPQAVRYYRDVVRRWKEDQYVETVLLEG